MAQKKKTPTDIIVTEHDAKMQMQENEIVLYQPNDSIHLEVRMANESVWLTQPQIALLFGVQRPAITKHLRNIFNSGELDEFSVSSILEHTASDGKTYQTQFYNLDAILSVGYRVNSINATMFRKWANSILKDYLLRGYSINQRFERLEHRMSHAEEKIDFFVRTALPPVEGIFYDGQIFDAYTFVSDLIQPVAIDEFQNAHDRFLCIDDTVYHIGASLKDLGKKWFAFSKMEINADALQARM